MGEEYFKDSLATLDFRGYSGGGQDLRSSAVTKGMSQAGIESRGGGSYRTKLKDGRASASDEWQKERDGQAFPFVAPSCQ